MRKTIAEIFGAINLQVALVGAASGPGAFLYVLAYREMTWVPRSAVWVGLYLSPFLGAGIFSLLYFALYKRILRPRMTAETRQRYRKAAPATYGVFLLTWLGLWGVFVPLSVQLWLFCIAQAVAVLWALKQTDRERLFASTKWPAFLFFLSGHAAIIYQVAWHRLLFTVFGLNIESVTVVVSIFMFGLGVGSLAGGWLGERFPSFLATLFTACELLIGVFGIFSTHLIQWVGHITLGKTPATTALACYLLLALPTLMMGATLPILVTFLHRKVAHVGRSVGVMYGVNTLGSALACFITVDALFPFLGLRGTVFTAALINLIVALGMIRYTKAFAAQKCPMGTLSALPAGCEES
jgi:hypothetical protein